MAPEKTYGAATTLSFAWIELDSVLLESRSPSNELDIFANPLFLNLYAVKKSSLKRSSRLKAGWILLAQLYDLVRHWSNIRYPLPLAQNSAE